MSENHYHFKEQLSKQKKYYWNFYGKTETRFLYLIDFNEPIKENKVKNDNKHNLQDINEHFRRSQHQNLKNLLKPRS